MNYKLILPAVPLRKYIRYFCVLESSNDSSIEKFKIMPNGAPGLIFQEDPTAFRDKYNQTLPQLFLFGQATQYAQLSTNGSFRNVAVMLQPTALKTVFAMDANELTDQHVDVNDLMSSPISDQLLNTRSLEQQLNVLEAFFLKQTAHRKQENEKLKFAYTQLQKGVELKQVQTDLNIGERSLERLFKTHIGITPKLYSRICRFQTTLHTLNQSAAASLTEIAYLENYFDQSHFIREFKTFAGTTPKSFLLKAAERVPVIPER
jgi:AraC-like DNA-binding protein